jgi:16S rRNA (guanine527-N7)-methyltransferase
LNDISLQFLANAAKDIGIVLSPGQLGAFNTFGDMLIDKNRHINLTAIDDESGIVMKHFIDSLAPAVYVDELSSLIIKMIDVGTGAGFPGIPLKILFGDKLDITLIDSTRKKIDFVNSVINTMSFRGCHAIHVRAEDAVRIGTRGSSNINLSGKYDFTIARAVVPLPKLLEYCIPFLKPGGIFVAMKGLRETAELELLQSKNTLNMLNAKLLRSAHYYLNAPKNPYSQDSSENPEESANGPYERTLLVFTKKPLRQNYKPKNSRAF